MKLKPQRAIEITDLPFIRLNEGRWLLGLGRNMGIRQNGVEMHVKDSIIMQTLKNIELPNDSVVFSVIRLSKKKAEHFMP